MTDERKATGEGGRDDGFEMSPAVLLRLAADGELTDAQREALDEHLSRHPEDRARLATERALGERAASTLRDVPVPAGLAERVMAHARASAATDSEADALADRLEAQAVRTRAPSFWRGGGGVLALAAAVALLVTTIVLVRPSSTGGDDEVLVAANFVGAEHTHCVTDVAHASRKFAVADPQAVPEAVRSITGESVDLAQVTALLGSGFEFEGAGACGVPGGQSIHLSFIGSEGSEWAGQHVSVFVQAAEAPHLKEGVTYKVVREAGQAVPVSDGSSETVAGETCAAGANVFFWRRGGSVYFLVTDSSVCDKPARSAFEAPAETEEVTL